jgi:hypothetical protein
LPIFDVQWGGSVKVTLNGVTEELLTLRQEGDSYCSHPAVLVSTDAARSLMDISDEDFNNYSLAQRSNLASVYLADYQKAVAQLKRQSTASVLHNRVTVYK